MGTSHSLATPVNGLSHDWAAIRRIPALGAVGVLILFLNFNDAEDSADEDGKFPLGFRVTFDRSHSPTKLKVTCRVSKVMTDEPGGARWPAIGCPEGDAGTRRQIETAGDDPGQAKLPL